MAMKKLNYKITKRFIEDNQGIKRDNPDHMIVIESGVWCNVKKKTIPIGTMHNEEFRRLTGIITYPSCDPVGTQTELITADKYFGIIQFIKSK